MTDRRILVTGDIPRFTHGGFGGAPCDAVDIVASSAGIPLENVSHLLHRPSAEALQRLHGMSRYAAGVGLGHLEEVMPSATELYIFDGRHLHLREWRHNRQVTAAVLSADDRNIEVHYFTSAAEFQREFLGE